MTQHNPSVPAEAGGVFIERAEGIVTVRLNRPKTRNAITEADIDRLIDEFATIQDSVDDRALILTGAEDTFCAGIDLARPPRRSMPRFMRRVSELTTRLYNLPVPTVAAVRGPAVGLGFSIALACDLILADDSAYFSMPFHRRGLALDGGATWLLPKRIGIGRAKEVALLSERITADRAQTLGITNSVVSPSSFYATTEQWLRRLASGPPMAQRMSKEMLNASECISLEAALTAEANSQSVAFTGGESKEGVRAFLAKREPVFPNA